MRSIKMGLLSAIVASICCTGPLILIALGLGGLGLGAAISKYHGLFLTAGILLILLSWGIPGSMFSFGLCHAQPLLGKAVVNFTGSPKEPLLS